MTHDQRIQLQERYARAIARHGAQRVARATNRARNVVMSVALGTAREGSYVLAAQALPMLDQLDQEAPTA